jgi:predicted nucleic acid binding AN1-type Zn finger protein
MTAYIAYQLNPNSLTEGADSVSYPSRGAMNFKTVGLAKAMNTQAAACIPTVFENISIISPNRNAKTNKSGPGIRTGSININIT